MSLVIDASDAVSILRVKRRIFSRLKGFQYLGEHECCRHPVHLSDCLSIYIDSISRFQQLQF